MNVYESTHLSLPKQTVSKIAKYNTNILSETWKTYSEDLESALKIAQALKDPFSTNKFTE